MCIKGYKGRPFQGGWQMTPGNRIFNKIHWYYKDSTEITQTEILLSILLISLVTEGTKGSCWEKHHFGYPPEYGDNQRDKWQGSWPLLYPEVVLGAGTFASLWNPVIRRDAPRGWQFAIPFGDFNFTFPAHSFFSSLLHARVKRMGQVDDWQQLHLLCFLCPKLYTEK